MTSDNSSSNLLAPLGIFLALTFTILANSVVPGLGILLAVTYATLLVAADRERVNELILAGLLFQNVLIAVTATAGLTPERLNLSRSITFLMCATIWGMAVLRYHRSPVAPAQDVSRLWQACLGVLGIIGVYFVYGLAGSAGASAIYLRNVMFPVLCLQIGIGLSAGPRAARFDFTWLECLLLAYCYLELFVGPDFLHLISGNAYFQAADPGFIGGQAAVAEDAAGSQFIVDFLNTNLLGDLGSFYRLNGPNLHPISLGYALATLFLLCFVKRRFWVMALFVPPIIVSGSKGAILYAVVVLAAMIGAQRLKKRWVFWAVAALLAVYAAGAFIVGLNAGDYHVLGLIGSLKGFASNVFGHGLGAGGNLSGALTVRDWQMAQQQGFTDVAVESAIGVMLFQMGLGGMLVIAFFTWVAWTFWTRYLATGEPFLCFAAFATLTLLVNGVFQEEALFAPLCLGFVLLIGATAFGAERPVRGLGRG